MEDVKWLLRKCGFPILIFLFVVIVLFSTLNDAPFFTLNGAVLA